MAGVTALAIPGTLPLSPASTAVANDRDKLDVRFQALLAQMDVDLKHWDTLGRKKCLTTALFGSLATDEAGIKAVAKRLLGLDPDNDENDLLEMARIVMV